MGNDIAFGRAAASSAASDLIGAAQAKPRSGEVVRSIDTAAFASSLEVKEVAAPDNLDPFLQAIPTFSPPPVAQGSFLLAADRAAKRLGLATPDCSSGKEPLLQTESYAQPPAASASGSVLPV